MDAQRKHNVSERIEASIPLVFMVTLGAACVYGAIELGKPAILAPFFGLLIGVAFRKYIPGRLGLVIALILLGLGLWIEWGQ
jgi:putative Mn2+ efflux pump MntP